jgi:hypothetical protein
MKTITVTGDQLIFNPSISTNSSKDEAYLQSGSNPFTSNDIITLVFDDNFNECISITINGTVLNPMNPGQTGQVQTDLSGRGCDYIVFNNIFTGNSELNGGRIMIVTNHFSGYPETYHGGHFCGQPEVCFCEDTKVCVDNNKYKKVKNLKVGEYLFDNDSGKSFEILWIGSYKSKTPPYSVNGEFYSAQHRIFSNGYWTIAKKVGIQEVYDGEEYTYYAILTKKHIKIQTEFNVVESMLVRPNSLNKWPEEDQFKILQCLQKANGNIEK